MRKVVKSLAMDIVNSNIFKLIYGFSIKMDHHAFLFTKISAENATDAVDRCHQN